MALFKSRDPLKFSGVEFRHLTKNKETDQKSINSKDIPVYYHSITTQKEATGGLRGQGADVWDMNQGVGT